MTPNIKEILVELRKGDGVLWEMALGELHSTYNEAPFWILVENVGDARKAAEVFSEIIKPHVNSNPDIQFTLAIYSIAGNKKIFIDYLEGNDIFDEQKIEKIGNFVEESDLIEDDLFMHERTRRRQT